MGSFIEYQQKALPLESYWRSIVLFGKNTASYKFSLGKALLEMASLQNNKVSLQDLAPVFARYICEHLKHSPKQITKADGNFLTACKQFNQNKITSTQLIDNTIKDGFNYVLDAFHVVNGGNIDIKFFTKNFHGLRKELILTDELLKLKEGVQFPNLEFELEARWRLVETAWNLGISTNVLKIEYSNNDGLLIVNNNIRRVNITSVRSALNGYQKGRCFYCFENINLQEKQNLDVDHFIPFVLQQYIPDVNLNGVWNLVLACKDCNRGVHGKFEKIPAPKYLERLYRRNEFLINSHHPLRETLLLQMGDKVDKRVRYLKNIYQKAKEYLFYIWETDEKHEPIF